MEGVRRFDENFCIKGFMFLKAFSLVNRGVQEVDGPVINFEWQGYWFMVGVQNMEEIFELLMAMRPYDLDIIQVSLVEEGFLGHLANASSSHFAMKMFA